MRNVRVMAEGNSRSNKYVIAVPNFNEDEVWSAVYYRMPKDVYDHKKYPTCQCGRKYVPIEGEDKNTCFFCIFTNR